MSISMRYWREITIIDDRAKWISSWSKTGMRLTRGKWHDY